MIFQNLFSWHDSPSGINPSHCSVFEGTPRHPTLGRAPLDEGHSRSWDFYLKTHNTQQHSEERDNNAPREIRTRNASKRAVGNPHFRQYFNVHFVTNNIKKIISKIKVFSDSKRQLCPSFCLPSRLTYWTADWLLLKFILVLKEVIVKWRIWEIVRWKRPQSQLILDLKLMYGDRMWQIFTFSGNFS